MQFFDLTHKISERTPVFPGTEKVQIDNIAEIESHGFREKYLHLNSHTATHMDAPAHMIQNGKFLDAFEVSAFSGTAVVLDVRNMEKQEISVSVLKNIDTVDFVLLQTGWDKKWGSAEYFKDFPVPSVTLAEALVKMGIKGVGIDAISIDAMESSTYPIHQILLGNNILIIENLTNLECLPRDVFQFAALPLKIEKADGAPVRAIAFK